MSPAGLPNATRSARRVALAVVAVLLGLSVWAGVRLEIATDIRHFIPSEAGQQRSDISAELAGSSLTRTSILALRGPTAVDAAASLASQLEAHPEVEWVRHGVDAALEDTLRALYYPRRAYLSRPDLSDRGLQEAAAELKRALAGPKGPLLRSVAPSDPLLLFPSYLQQLRLGDGGKLQTIDGQFVTHDGAAIVFVRTRNSAFASAPQVRFQTDLAAMVDGIRDAGHPGLTLSQSGLARFAIATERSTRADVTRVSVVSTVAIIIVFWVLFGQLRAIVLAFAPVVLGVGGGVLACSLLVDEVHGLTLAFGAALLGVGVDYAVHLMFHLGHPGARTNAEVVTRIRPGLMLGAATTVAGLAGLALTTFPGMRELSLFGAVGIAGSLAVTLLVVPAFGAALPQRRMRTWLIDVSRRILDRIERLGSRAWIGFALVVATGTAGLIPLQWSDGLRALYQVDADLLAEDTQVRELTGAVDMSRMVVASGEHLQEALEGNQRVFDAVRQAQLAGELAGFRSVQPWLPAAAWQQDNRHRLRDPAVAARFDAAFEAEGFRRGVFSAFFEELRGDGAGALALGDVQNTALWPIVEPFILRLENRVVVVTWLRGPLPGNLRETLSRIPGVELFDQQEFLDRAYGRYRREMIRMLTFGLAGVALLIFIRYRSLRTSAAAFLPAVAGAVGAIGIAGWVDGTANLIHVASLLLVCSIGADYGVFMVESRDDRRERGVTMAASLLAGLTTMLSFGLLAMSDNPALASVGRSVVVGVVCALLTAPVAATLRGEKR